jgi:hypothetical protein
MQMWVFISISNSMTKHMTKTIITCGASADDYDFFEKILNIAPSTDTLSHDAAAMLPLPTPQASFCTSAVTVAGAHVMRRRKHQIPATRDEQTAGGEGGRGQCRGCGLLLSRPFLLHCRTIMIGSGGGDLKILRRSATVEVAASTQDINKYSKEIKKFHVAR